MVRRRDERTLWRMDGKELSFCPHSQCGVFHVGLRVSSSIVKVQHREAGGGKSSVKHGSREETAEIFVCGRSDGWGTVREENRLVC